MRLIDEGPAKGSFSARLGRRAYPVLTQPKRQKLDMSFGDQTETARARCCTRAGNLSVGGIPTSLFYAN
jgi:hypothetical protein